MYTVGKSDCDMFNADPAWLQDQGLDRTKIIINKKKGVKDCREIVKTAIVAICMVNIRPDMMHACVWPTKIINHTICHVWCLKGMGGAM